MHKSPKASSRRTGRAIKTDRSRKSLPREQPEEPVTPKDTVLTKIPIEKSEKGSNMNIEAANAAAVEENVNASEIDQPQPLSKSGIRV